jgi:hypothetical protein
MAVFWVVAPCSLVEVYQRFRGPCCLHRQGDATTQKTAIFVLTAVRTSNPAYKSQVQLHIFNRYRRTVNYTKAPVFAGGDVTLRTIKIHILTNKIYFIASPVSTIHIGSLF